MYAVQPPCLAADSIDSGTRAALRSVHQRDSLAVLYVYSQVRRMLQPLLAEIYGEGYAHALTRLADDSVQLR